VLNTDEGKIHTDVNSAPGMGIAKQIINTQIQFRRKTADSDQTTVLYKQSPFYAACSGFSGN